jgi:hypothetical protein
MDRSLWLSLMAVGLVLALLFTVRAAVDAGLGLHAASLIEQIEAFEGGPSTEELGEAVNAAAGCIYGNRPRIRSCWYVWQAPTRGDYQLVVGERVLADASSSAVSWALGSLPFWIIALFAAWKATRRPVPFKPARSSPTPDRPRPGGRLIP